MGMLDTLKGISQEPHNNFTVIFGKPGSAKTTIAGTFPKPMLYIGIETDGGGEVLKCYSDDEIKTISLVSDTPGTTGAKNVQMKLMDLLEELKGEHPFKTVVIDAYSSIEESVVAYSEKVKGKKLSLDERGQISSVMLALRDKIISLSRGNVEYVAICHVKDKECTDNTTGEKSTMIIPKMTYNNGNLLLERASAVIYCARKTIINDDGSRRVAFLTYLGAHPNMDTKLRTKGKVLDSGLYVENLTYDKLQEIINGTQAVEEITKLNVVEPTNNPFEENKENNNEENW